MRILGMRAFVFALALSVTATAVAADVPPLRVPVDELVENISCVSDQSQSYTLYLPPGFTTDRRWPLLLVFDPRGRSVLAAELFREAARDYGWIIVSSNDTRSDGPMEPNIKALNALWPEVHSRLPADPERIYAAGFSGGGAVAYVLARSTHEVAGIIACGARFLPDDLEAIDAPVFSVAGDTDFNYLEMREVDAFLAAQGNAHRFASFAGPHSWMPAPLASETVGWLELEAMKSGLRPRDPALIESLYAADLAAADALAAEGRDLDAARSLRATERTFEGLRNTSAVTQRAETLEASPAYREELADEKRWDAFEAAYVRETGATLARFRVSQISPPVAQLSRELRIPEMLSRGSKPGIEGLTARRALQSPYTALSFYLPRDFLAEKRWGHLATSLETALLIREDNAVAWYNLACARAQTNHPRAAVEALQRALEEGFNQPALLASDPDLDPLRKRKDFKVLVTGQ
jgi:predicted esterase